MQAIPGTKVCAMYHFLSVLRTRTDPLTTVPVLYLQDLGSVPCLDFVTLWSRSNIIIYKFRSSLFIPKLWFCISFITKINITELKRISVQGYITLTNFTSFQYFVVKRYRWDPDPIFGGVTWRPETMCPRAIVLGPLVPKLIDSCDTMSLDWYIPVIVHHTISLGCCKMTGMYQCRHIVYRIRDDSSRGQGVPENSYGDTSFRDIPSPHPIFMIMKPNRFRISKYKMRNLATYTSILEQRGGD